MNNRDTDRSNVISEAEAVTQNEQQDNPEQGQQPEASSRPQQQQQQQQQQNAPLQQESSHQEVPPIQHPVHFPLPNYHMQPHLPYMSPFVPQPPFPFIPPHAPHFQPHGPFPPPPFPQYPGATVSTQYYEARMRDHAAAYASAAAGAAWAAAQMAAAAADFAAGGPMLSPPFHSNPRQPYPVPPFIPSDHHANEDPHQQQQQYDLSNLHHRRKRRPRLEEVPGRITAKQHRGRRRGGEDSSSTSSCSTFLRKGERKKKDRSDESLLGKTAVAALYEWCSRRNHLPSFVLQQITPTHFDCVVTLEDDVEWGHGQGGNKGAAKKEAARQALQSLCPTVVFDETSGFVIALRNAVEDLAPHLAKQLAIDAADDNISSTTEFSEDENDFYKSAQGATVLSNLLFTTIQIDPRISEAVPTFTYQMAPVVQNHPLKRKTTTSDNSRGRFTCTAELKINAKESKEEVLQAKGVGTSKREARHMACARLLVKLFPECGGSFVKVKKAAEAARARYKSIRMSIRGPPFPEAIVTSFQHLLDQDTPPSTTSAMRLISRRKQVDSRVEKALHNYYEEEGKIASGEATDIGRTFLRRAEPQDLTLVKKLLWPDNEVPAGIISSLWSSSCIVFLLCRDPCYDDPPLGCAVLTFGFQFTEGQVLRVKHLSTESHLPQERFLDCLKDFSKFMNCTLIEDSNKTASVKCEDAQLFVQNQLKLRLKSAPSTTSQTLQSVQEAEEEGSDDSEKRPVAKVASVTTNPSKRSRVV